MLLYLSTNSLFFDFNFFHVFEQLMAFVFFWKSYNNIIDFRFIGFFNVCCIKNFKQRYSRAKSDAIYLSSYYVYEKRAFVHNVVTFASCDCGLWCSGFQSDLHLADERLLYFWALLIYTVLFCTSENMYLLYILYCPAIFLSLSLLVFLCGLAKKYFLEWLIYFWYGRRYSWLQVTVGMYWRRSYPPYRLW